MRFLLDTNILSSLIRDPQGRIAERIKIVGEQSICTSIVVAAELRYGAAKKASPRLIEQVEAVLDVIEILPLELPADEIYGSIRTQLESEPPFGTKGSSAKYHVRAAAASKVATRSATALTTRFGGTLSRRGSASMEVLLTSV